MATGDQTDISARIRAVLPAGWFPVSPLGGPSATPVLDGILAGLGATWAAMYSLLQYVRLQTRIATATDFFLDLIGADFFATALLRQTSETDAAYSARIRKNLLRPKGTRAALTLLLTDLTGLAPTIIEPFNPGDCGAWDTGAIAWDTAGYWGDILPFWAFVVVYRIPNGGIAGVEGWYDASESAAEAGGWDAPGGGAQPAGWDQAGGAAVAAGFDQTATIRQIGGWDQGAIEWTDASMVKIQISDADIYAAIADCMPVATIAWVAITEPGGSFIVGQSVLGGADQLG